ncbi:MAG: LPS export ABC transporter permease LptF [Desulfobacterales bacterium]|jgi:lipopolysaccharide export system permease protein|nr:LPS export ABC transporter permease LptF [Desulfobacterales bacterium]
MILQRYIITEIIKPTAAILFVLIAIFASYTAVTYLAEAVVGALPPATVGLLILLKIGMALEVLLPTTFYLSVVIALGRLYKDSEMTAFASCGVGMGGVLKPVIALALPLALAAAGASLLIRPAAYEQIYRILDQAKNEFDISRLVSDHFLVMDSGRLVFFADRVGEGGEGADQVFIRLADGNQRQVITAGGMTQVQAERGGRRSLVFRDGTFHQFSSDGGGGRVTRFERAEYPLPVESPSGDRHRRKAVATERLLGSPRLEDIAELQWRLSTPLSTLLLAMLGVPLSRSDPRKGKYANLGLAVLIFAFYYQLFVIAKTWVEKGLVPPVMGIWWVPLLLALLAAVLLWKTGEVFWRRPR